MGGGLDGNFSDSELNEYEEKPYDVIHLNINYPDRVHIKNCGKTLSLSDSSKSVLQLALKEQRKNVARLFEEQKREKEAALEKVLELERSSKCEKRNLELEIKLLRAELAVAKLVGNGVNDDDDDASIQQKIDGMPTIRQEAFKKLVAVRHLKC
ncbi:hypothetical protein OROGR_004888 [Orobanche gracilis]